MRAAARLIVRLFARVIFFSVKKPAAVFALTLALTAAALGVVLAGNPEPPEEFSDDSLYVQIEFEGGLLKEEVDRRLAAFARALKQNGAVKNVETSAKTGQGNGFVSFDHKKITPHEIRELVRSVEIPGGFVYIGELTGKERSWRISVSGDDDARCREIAHDMAALCAGIPAVIETVLNFKKGGPRLALKPDRRRIAGAGRSFATLGDTVRRAVHAPVAYKRLNSTEENGGRGEIDVRIQAGLVENPGKKEVETMMLSGGSQNTGASALQSLVTMEEEEEVSGIWRENRRRTASISVRTRAVGAHKARALIMPALETTALPENYTITFDRDAIEAEEALRKSVFYVILALLFCYIVIAMANESFSLPFITLAAVPPSMAFPLLIVTALGFRMSVSLLCAFIAVTGITVNASVLTVDALRRVPHNRFPAVYRALRGRMNALFATGGTTIASAVPFILLPENANRAVKMLALVSALGVAGSCLVSISLIPALMTGLKPRRDQPLPPG